jgi:hypothetical protein
MIAQGAQSANARLIGNSGLGVSDNPVFEE